MNYNIVGSPRTSQGYLSSPGRVHQEAGLLEHKLNTKVFVQPRLHENLFLHMFHVTAQRILTFCWELTGNVFFRGAAAAVRAVKRSLIPS